MRLQRGTLTSSATPNLEPLWQHRRVGRAHRSADCDGHSPPYQKSYSRTGKVRWNDTSHSTSLYSWTPARAMRSRSLCGIGATSKTALAPKPHGRVMVTVLLPASLPVVSLTKTLNEATSPGLSRPVVVLRLSVSDGTVATTVAVAAS